MDAVLDIYRALLPRAVPMSAGAGGGAGDGTVGAAGPEERFVRLEDAEEAVVARLEGVKCAVTPPH